MDRDEAIKRIKSALKRRSGKSWSVTGGRGTAWGWISISAPPKRCTWRTTQTRSPEPPTPDAYYEGALGITPQYRVQPGAEDRITSPANDPWAREAVEQGRDVFYNWSVSSLASPFGSMGSEDRLELGRLLGMDKPVHHQGESVPASGAYREEYVARAEGRTPAVYGERYWD
jgi:hypothetical protein